MEKIEEGLRKAHSLPNVWTGLLTVCDIKPGSEEDRTLQDLLVRSLNSKGKMDHLKSKILAILASDEARTIGMLLLGKAIDLGIKAMMGSK